MAVWLRKAQPSNCYLMKRCCGRRICYTLIAIAIAIPPVSYISHRDAHHDHKNYTVAKEEAKNKITL